MKAPARKFWDAADTDADRHFVLLRGERVECLRANARAGWVERFEKDAPPGQRLQTVHGPVSIVAYPF
jgi:hypothetical protein